MSEDNQRRDNGGLIAMRTAEDNLWEEQHQQLEPQPGAHDAILSENKLREQFWLSEKKMAEMTLLQQEFMSQSKLCISELHALVHACCQCTEGENPDISMLLGISYSENEELTDEMVDGKDLNSDNMAKTLSLWLSQLRELRKEIGQLRENVCNKYAENMGDSIDCAMQ